ncbi:MAG: hypothetical protein WEF53_03920 [Bacteroidota bacterium]
MTHFTKATLFLLFAVLSMARGDEKTWNLVLSDGDTLYDYTILHVSEGMLMISKDGIDSVAIDAVVLVFRRSEGDFWTGAAYGAAYGAAAGAVIGAVIGASSYEKPKPKKNDGYFSQLDIGFEPSGSVLSAIGGGVLGSLGGLVVGGIIGSSSGRTDSYELAGKPLRTKIMVLRMLSKQNTTGSDGGENEKPK